VFDKAANRDERTDGGLQVTGPADAVTGVRPFVDRSDAGQRLAGVLPPLRGQDVLVLGIARGGVPVAAQVARSLGAELDVVVTRKIGVPLQPELALGAVTADGSRFTNLALVRELKLSTWLLRLLADEQRAEARRNVERLRGHRPPPRITGRTVIVVDDGLATGATMRAALRSVQRSGPSRVVAAAPVAAWSTARALRGEAEVVCLLEPDPFFAVGRYYQDFQPVSDDAVRQLLAEGIRSVRVDA
jgi:putative phosphoribosyl transferase